MAKARQLADLLDGTGNIASSSVSLGDLATLLDGSGNVVTSALGNLLDGNGDVELAALGNVPAAPTPNDLPSDWTATLSGSDLVFNHSGTAKFKLTSAGAVVAIDDVTGFGSI